MSRFRRHARFVAGALATAVVLAEDVKITHAALTTPSCLALKRKAWGDLRKCQANAAVKTLKGKVGDPAKCQTQFQTKLDKIDAKATKAAIACRYGNNGDGTVTDYDTGLQWERKLGGNGLVCPAGNLRCVDETFDQDEARDFISALNGESSDGTAIPSSLAGFSDWRLPTIVEFNTILLSPQEATAPLIDPIFGGTRSDNYWTDTTISGNSSVAWTANFSNGLKSGALKSALLYVRAVRSAL